MRDRHVTSKYIEEQKFKVEQLKERLHARTTRSGLSDSSTHKPATDDASIMYYWVYGLTNTGKKVTLGPYISAGEADARASKLDDAEILQLPTRDRSRAVQQIRAILLKRGESIDKVLERQLSGKGFEREKKKFRLPFRH